MAILLTNSTQLAGGLENPQKHAYVIFEWSLTTALKGLVRKLPLDIFQCLFFTLGVRELFESSAPEAPRKTRAELMKDIDAAYYGFRDDDDGLLVPLEVEAEKAAIG